jgi:hypothetical protein
VGDPFNTITIYSNAGFDLALDFEDDFGYEIDISTWEIAFIIAADRTDGVFQMPSISNTTPILTPGTGKADFHLTTSDTRKLSNRIAYHYIVMYKIPTQDPVVYRYGRVKAISAPPMP